MNKNEFVYGIGDIVRFTSDPNVMAVVTGIVLRKGGCSFIVSDKGQETEVDVDELMSEDAWVPGLDADEGEVEL
jgi:hypothetical protein